MLRHREILTMHTIAFNKWLDDSRKVNNCENALVNVIALWMLFNKNI